MKIELTDTEWMQLVDGERQDSQLPTCCGNVSALRDSIIVLARQNGHCDLYSATKFLKCYEFVADGHDLSSLFVLQKIKSQISSFDFSSENE